MNPEQRQFLLLTKFPARLTMEQAAWLLGFHIHEIPILVEAKLLKPLGHPARTGSKYFSSDALHELAQDARWLERASDTVIAFWRKKNARRAIAQNETAAIA